MFRLIFLLLGAAVFVTSHQSYTEKIKFQLKQNDEARFMFSPINFYSRIALSSDPSVCVNLTTSAPVNVSLGSCVRSTYVGIFGNGSVQLTQEVVDEAMAMARDDELICRRRPVGIYLSVTEEPASGVFNLFRCVPNVIRSRPADKLILRPVMDTAVTTWTDMRRDISFNVVGGETWQARIGLARAVDLAILNEKDYTICLAVNGVDMANVTFAKCRNQGGFSAYVKSGTNFGLRAELWEMRQENCGKGDDTRDTDWWLKVNSMDQEPISGHVSVFSCKEHKKSNGKSYVSTYTPNQNYMGYWKEIAFAQGPIQETVYSADIMEIISAAAFNEPGLFNVQMTVETMSPVSISLSRCRHSEPKDRVLLVAHQSSGIVVLDHLQKIVNLTRLPKCGLTESDEALYLRVRSNLKAIGSVKFSLERSEGKDDSPLRNKPVFKVPQGGHIVRDYPIGNIFDRAMVNNLPLGIVLETTSNVTISVSKCPNSPRQILLENCGTGTFHLPWNQVIAAVNGFMDIKCEDAELWQSDFLFVRIDSPFGEAVGSLQVVSLQVNGTKSTRREFEEVDPFFKATEDIQLIKLVKPNDTLTNSLADFDTYPEEIDIRFFVETVLQKPEFSLFFKTDRPVNLILNRCLNNSTEGLQITATENTPLTHDDVVGLKVLMKNFRCDNKALNGIFVHIPNKDYTGPLEIYMMENYNPSPKKNIKIEDLMNLANVKAQ